MHLAECGFCADGEQEELVAAGATEIDGPMPVKIDGGLIANGKSRSACPACARSTRSSFSSAVRPVSGRSSLCVGFTEVYW